MACLMMILELSDAFQVSQIPSEKPYECDVRWEYLCFFVLFLVLR